jgi:hypothetical protein
MTPAAAACLLEVLRHLKGVLRAVEKWVLGESGHPEDTGRRSDDHA